MATKLIERQQAEPDAPPTTMLALVKPAPSPGAELRQVAVPTIGAGDVLIKVRAASICGTDLHIYNWDPWAAHRLKPPIVFGHEFCGTAVRIGSEVTKVAVGDFIAAESHITCGVCRECRQGQLHACRNVSIIGVDRPGAFAQFVAIPEGNAWPVSETLSPEIATIEEPMGNTVHTISETPIVGANVAIFGLGPLGLFAIPIARVYGAKRVFGIEPSPFRAQIARQMGIDRVLDPQTDDVPLILAGETAGEGVDVVLEMSGSQAALSQSLASLRYGGTLALLGLPSKPLEVNIADHVIFKGTVIKGIVGRRIPETWHQTRGLLESGMDISPIITDRLPLTEFETAFSLLGSGRSGKIILYPNGSDDQS